MIRPSQFRSFKFGGGGGSSNATPDALLAFIVSYQKEHGGVSPSFPDMMAGLGVNSKATIHRHLKLLVARGSVRSLPHGARAIDIVRPQDIPRDLAPGPKPVLDLGRHAVFVVSNQQLVELSASDSSYAATRSLNEPTPAPGDKPKAR